MRAIFVTLATATVLAACSCDGPVSVAAQVDLTQHEALWHQRDFHSYSFDLAQVRLASTGNFHVTVRADTVAGVLDNQTGLPPVNPPFVSTIDDLFVDANHAITDDKVNIDLEFNDQIGYPTVYAVSSKLGDPGGPFSARISNFVANP